MAALATVKAEPTNPLRGIVNDYLFASLGLPTVEEALGTPADVMNVSGVPPIKKLLPTPFDAYTQIVTDIRRGRLNMPNIGGLLAKPGEGVATAGPAGRETTAETGYKTPAAGAQGMFGLPPPPPPPWMYAQQYYQRY